MKPYQTAFLQLISTLLFFVFGWIASTTAQTIKQPIIQGVNTALYEVVIDYKKQHISGLVYFKKQDEKVSIVYLSQLGLNLLVLEFENNNMEVVSCQKFLDRPVLLKSIKRDLLMVLDSISFKNNMKLTHRGGESVKIFKGVGKSGRYRYFLNSNDELLSVKRKALFNSTKIDLEFDTELIPQEIKYKHRPIRLSIKYKLKKVR